MTTNYLEPLIQEAERVEEKFKGRGVDFNKAKDVQVGITPHDVVFTENKLNPDNALRG